ncbi:DUF6286 domain-containing protein [Dietzia cinnamea]|uniref:DUF6286 domain-containing protein n=1 Tax=Dietzia cinnamea TaxID=321318 RepID=UPI001957EAB1|nr:DUF6286 domain-containing protein [Dietzia cinnamea]MBM7232022.1 alkaline shock response membrane anchor protein AmaP [Dietzia cinnamea]MCT2061218.1 DUF6286 domain-containing protein [Dietzia cinnamea]MCT2077535.1 DUF6286 domain-containing protein [Dietzia cinnamea]MCT2221842.1 DUF6286 domain-containing protein [Dietzia cinnamea]MCT2235189.1 DUF6286 domain-containing protein [Dietzia cinnamea]
MSARPRRSTLIRRPPRAIPVGLLAVALVVLGGLGIWLLGSYLINDTWPLAASSTVASVAETGLDSTAMRVVAVVLALVGLALLVSALVPGRPSRVRVLDDDIPGETAISHRDLARRIERRTENVDGVHSTRVSVRPRRIDVAVKTVVDDPAPVTQGAKDAVDHALCELRPADPLRPRVRTDRRS